MVRLLADIVDTPTVGAGSGTVILGNGSPEGVATADPAAFFWDQTGEQLYFKDSGNGNTGWRLIS